VQLLLRRGANALQSNLRGKTPVDVAASDVIAHLLRGEDNGHRQQTAAMSSDDSDVSATSPSSVGGCTSPRLSSTSDSSSYPVYFVRSLGRLQVDLITLEGGLKCPSVGTSLNTFVRPQKVFPISVKFVV